MSAYAIKMRHPTAYRYAYLTARGGLSNLRVLAQRFAAQQAAEAEAEKLRVHHPKLQVKVVPL
jgi:hypothetical protein